MKGNLMRPLFAAVLTTLSVGAYAVEIHREGFEIHQFALLAEVRGEGAVACLDDALLVDVVDPGFELKGCQRHLMLPAGSTLPSLDFLLKREDKPFSDAPMKIRLTGVSRVVDAKTDRYGKVASPAGTEPQTQPSLARLWHLVV